MRKIFQLLAFIISLLTSGVSFTQEFKTTVLSAHLQPEPNNTGLKLPSGFQAAIVADGLGKARHLVVSPQGNLYVKLEKLKDGKGIFAYKTVAGNKAEKIAEFGDFIGTGITIKDNYLYASSNSEVYRYQLNEKGEVIRPDKPEKIVSGLWSRRQHESKSIVLDNSGNLYVNIGAPSNDCQENDRVKGSPGMNPCPILDSAGGIWQFKADKADQTYKDGIRYATGLRNVVGLDWNTVTDQLFVTQHGRDQLYQFFPELYDAKQSAELPAETMYAIKKGDNCGWPYIYYDHIQKKKILSPEYGGDGKKIGGENAIDPVVAFPGHLAPNALLFYTGNAFPEHYRNGAFIAFHGSWNRAPEKQKGYFVAFVPFKDGKPNGPWEIFADDFAGTDDISNPGNAQHRPCGLAQGPDGALYISDDAKGTIYKITFPKK
jgi:glucose/arabinose dehydrogenase